MIAKIEKLVGELAGKTLGVLGLSFKPNTDDVRDSPAIWIIRELQRRGAHVRCYDPQAMENGRARARRRGVLRGRRTTPRRAATRWSSPTEWNEFRKLDLALLKERLRQPVVVDMRNICEPAEMKRLGFRYTGVGR